ncbi:OBAP family protein [Pseudomonas anatoliensis]|uniref:OBAP family protein n=1 Tax=Pseudomonas anatoliensis TaxID=2710589 RepID=UPI001B3390EE|nr:OBAP family protein [Pseudomonas anatoliensis]MBP5956104.1 OBAP family protein [Pseudomonas anatoliensis]
MIRGNSQRIFFTALRPSLILTGLCLLTACAVNTTPSYVVAPGEEKTATTRALDTGAALLQSRPPINELNAYLDGFHFYSGHPDAQMEAHHYCSILNEQVIQCVIYDGNRKDAKLMGVEYIIDEQLFSKLPNAERALWHSHVHEVKSGQLIAPGIPDVAEHALMEKLIHTYGKTWHTWHTDLNKDLPLGVPQLMMGFTSDGQIDQRLVTDRDRRFGVDSTQKKEARADIPVPAIDPGADAWRNGKVIQIEDPTGNEHRH